MYLLFYHIKNRKYSAIKCLLLFILINIIVKRYIMCVKNTQCLKDIMNDYQE